MHKITTCFFDLGNVLVSFSHDKMWSELSKICNTPSKTLMEIINTHNLWTLYEVGEISTKELINSLEKYLNSSFNHDAFILAASDIFEEIKEMISLLQELHKQHIKLALISNTCEIHFEYIKKRYPFFYLFDEIILSYNVKMKKPDKNIFTYALKKTKSISNETLFIDDLPEHVESAKELGIHGHIFKDVQTLKKDFLHFGIKL